MTLNCHECSKKFHVACAYAKNYKFAFEVQVPIVSNKKKLKDIISVKFKDAEGARFYSLRALHRIRTLTY